MEPSITPGRHRPDQPPPDTARPTRAAVPAPRDAGQARTCTGAVDPVPVSVLMAPRVLTGWPLAVLAFGVVVMTYAFILVLLSVVKTDPHTAIVLTVLALSAAAAFVGMFVLTGATGAGLARRMASAAAGALSGWRR